MIASVKPPLVLKKRVLSKNQLRLRNFSLGSQGETRAISFLKQLNYQILDTNVRLRNQEVDIIAKDPVFNEIVFIEVKTRSSNSYGDPSAAVSSKKLKNMKMVAQSYLQRRQLENEYRFDIISVLEHSIEHYQNVSWTQLR